MVRGRDRKLQLIFANKFVEVKGYKYKYRLNITRDYSILFLERERERELKKNCMLNFAYLIYF